MSAGDQKCEKLQKIEKQFKAQAGDDGTLSVAEIKKILEECGDMKPGMLPPPLQEKMKELDDCEKRMSWEQCECFLNKLKQLKDNLPNPMQFRQ